MHILKAIEEQKAGRDLIVGALLTVCLGGVAFMVSVYPSGGLEPVEFRLFAAASVSLGISFLACIVSLFRKMAEADLIADITQIPGLSGTLEKMQSDPNVTISQTKRGDMLAFRMRVITWAFRVALIAFSLWLILLAAYGYVAHF